MQEADFLDYHQNGSLVPEGFDSFKFCPYCGLYDSGYADNCSVILHVLHLGMFEAPVEYFKWLRDFTNPINHGYDFIEFYGTPIYDTQVN